jgi:ribose transport system ATP-binding protein
VETTNILETKAINKSYPGVQALKSVDFELKRGEVHALVGQNGAGKSTFIEIIAGSLWPDSGRIVLDGGEYTHFDPSLSIELGIQTVHQENQLVDELTVAENIYLYDLPRTRLGFVNISTCVEMADKLLQDDLGIEIKSSRKLSSLTFVEKKFVSITKAFSRKAKILILDEPTSSLDDSGKKVLFELIRRYSELGLSTIYISHNLGEIFEVCNRVTVLKDGKRIDTHNIVEIDMNTIVQEMIGKSSLAFLYVREQIKGIDSKEKPALEIQDYHSQGVVDHVSFSVQRGEIFGLGGLVGSGRTELARLIFGLDRKDSGNLIFEGKDITPISPSDAISKGLGYLTEDRKDDGLVLIRPVFENISIVKIARNKKGRMLNLRQEQDDTERAAKQLDIKTPSITQEVINLSGGNQQKVVMAKWFFAESEIIIFDEPTVGVDVGSKSEIFKLIDNLAQKGKIIIMISSDNPELVAVCNRVGIMRFGKLVTILEGSRINEESILKNSFGMSEGGS